MDPILVRNASPLKLWSGQNETKIIKHATYDKKQITLHLTTASAKMDSK